MSDRREEILDVAQYLTQVRGVNGFSYVEISNRIGIKTSSIHYYFKTKNDLVIALIKRYHAGLELKLDTINSTTTISEEKLIKFSEIFKDLASTKDKFCLCGMMAAELGTLSEEARKELVLYFQSCREWLSQVFLLQGSKRPQADAEAYLSLLEGGLLIARVKGRSETIDEIVDVFVRIINKNKTVRK